MLMADAGAGTQLTNANLTFDDAAPAFLPQTTAISSGRWKPTSYDSGETIPPPPPVVPAVVVPGGFYPDGLPFGLELSARRWKDGDLLSWAYAYEQATRHRRPPVLVENGLLPDAR